MGYFVFDSFQAFEASFGRHGDKIVADVVNYTKVQLLIQISLIKLQGSERSGNSRQPLQPIYAGRHHNRLFQFRST